MPRSFLKVLRFQWLGVTDWGDSSGGAEHGQHCRRISWREALKDGADTLRASGHEDEQLNFRFGPRKPGCTTPARALCISRTPPPDRSKRPRSNLTLQKFLSSKLIGATTKP